MQRAVLMCLFASLSISGCALKTKSKCPDVFTPADAACAEQYCDEHPSEPACVQFAADAGAATAADPTHARCASSDACGAGAPHCEQGACAACRDASDCARFLETPACDPSGACVACTGSDAKLCTAQGKVCASGPPRCADCNTNADCMGATRPICDASMCRGCKADADCASAGKVCREQTGECVDCQPNADDPTKENCANGRACDPRKFSCTGHAVRTLGVCASSAGSEPVAPGCISDSECLVGRRCVPTEFPRGSPYGSYCLQPVAVGVCPNGTSIERDSASTLDVAAKYCFPNESYATCESLEGFRTLCATDSECGAPDRDDGICRSGRCTYRCNSVSDCPDVACTEFNGVKSCATQ